MMEVLPVRRSASAVLFALLIFAGSGPAFAQVPVIDEATLSQAKETASNTAEIMSSNSDILQTVNKTLAAVTGNRSTAEIAGTALGSGFTMGNAPDFSSLLSGQMAWGKLGSYGTTASTILNGLNLVKTLSGQTDSASYTRGDKSYQALVNTATALTAAISGTHAGTEQRVQSFQNVESQIGTTTDIKGSIDQNSQVQTQTAQTVNELVGAVNAGNAALNAQQMQQIAAEAAIAEFMTYDSSKVTLTGQ
ncbi:type IV secretion system protein [Rhizobium sp. BK376]|uniref:type IV secretion system protein n=1 Tax=Rhizobium sp. BK376 TaxID=2512149 RepID=UPI0010D8B639|nr:type IV secretion system protein [Rhizobium sp. BK376]TCR74055.1 type IV secretion system VirB5/TraC/TraE/TrbJ family protein [Rhizobium sp. BK376]